MVPRVSLVPREQGVQHLSSVRPMAPGRTSARRAQHHEQRAHDIPQHHNVHVQQQQIPPQEPAIGKDDIFLEPMMGTPQALYVEKDVENRDQIVALITVRVAPSFS